MFGVKKILYEAIGYKTREGDNGMYECYRRVAPMYHRN